MFNVFSSINLRINRYLLINFDKKHLQNVTNYGQTTMNGKLDIYIAKKKAKPMWLLFKQGMCSSLLVGKHFVYFLFGCC